MNLRERLQSVLGNAYLVQQELGGGGMSRVFVAEETSLGRPVVVKVLPPELAAEMNAERFRREIQLAARLQHPHIVPLFSAGDADGLLYYTMPLVEGESLRERLARERELPVADAVRIMREVADALGHAHERGVVHRDVKPENVLLSRGHATVADFGVAKALRAATPEARLTSTGLALGTVSYMAPEQALGDPAVDHRADLYALGVVAYEMLSGEPPFAGRSLQATLTAHVTEAPERLSARRPGIPAALDALVMQLLEKRPADRPQSAAEVLRVIDALSAPEPTGAATAAAPIRPAPRSRALPWVAGVASLALLAIVVAVLATRDGPRESAPAAAARRVAVVPFENLTGDASLDHVGRVATDWLTQGLVQAESVQVVSSAAVGMAVASARGAPAGLLPRIAEATGATLVVSGSVSRRGADSVQLRAQVVEMPSGEIQSALGPVVAGIADPSPAIEELLARLQSALVSRNVMASTLRAYAPPYPAYKEFVVGQALFQRQRDYAGARPYFEAAIAIDPEWGLPYNMLALTYANAGAWDQADSVVRRLEALRPRLPSIGVLQLDGLRATLRGDIEESLRMLQLTVERESNPVMQMLIGMTANDLLRPRVAVPSLEQSDALMTATGALQQPLALATAYHQSGQHEQELQALRTARARLPARELLGHQLRAYAALGRGGDAVALADTLLRGITDAAERDVALVVAGAAELRAHGDTGSARRLLEMARAWHASHRAATARPGRALAEGRVLYLLGDHAGARARLVEATRDTLSLDAAGYLALATLAAGDRARATAIGDSLGALPRRWLFGAHTFWHAAIVGALGDRERAVQLLRKASAEGASKERWHFDPALDALRGYPPFEELIRPER